MKLLYFSGTYCPSIGGAEISVHSLLKRLQKEQNIDIIVLTDKKYSNGNNAHEFEGIKILGTIHDNREEFLREFLKSYRPDFLMTQLLWSDIGLKISREEKIKSIMRVCKIPFSLNIGETSEYHPDKIMVVSEPVREYILKNWSLDSYVSNPIVESDRVSKGDKFSNEYILMFNNLERKGANTFAKTAELLQNYKFAIVPGWDMLKKGNLFDETLLKHMCESLGVEYKGQKPKIITDFPENVSILQPDFDVRKIYSKSRILCIPSIWQETFGRVAIEGMINEIPVIGSAVGGLKSIVENGGISIEDYENPHAWAEQITFLSKRENYDACLKRGKDFISKYYDPSKIAYDFGRWIKND